jgi:hypothetical protein
MAFVVTLGLLAEQQKPPAIKLVFIAVTLGAIATVAFVGELAFGIRDELQKRKIGRLPEPKFGRLNYAPEYVRAAEDYTNAQTRITEKCLVLQRTNPDIQNQADSIRQQKAANEAAEALQGLV